MCKTCTCQKLFVLLHRKLVAMPALFYYEWFTKLQQVADELNPFAIRQRKPQWNGLSKISKKPLGVATYQLEQVVERTVKELEQQKKEKRDER